MKQLTKTLSALMLLPSLGISAFAAEKQEPLPHEQSMPGGMQGMKHEQGGMQGMTMKPRQGGMGMMGEMSNEQMDQHMRMMQEHMLQMHDLSNKILAATDPAEKEKLKKQQLDLMKSHKKQMMHGNMGQKDEAGQKKSPAPQQDTQHQKHSNM